MTPSSEIYLLSVPELESNYSNTYLFDTILSQKRFFLNKQEYKLEQYTYLRKESSIKINIHIDDLYEVNYIMYKNKKDKWYYAFIMDKVYINENVTQIIIATDVIQTYMFDFILAESYVDRCHVDRWKDTPEGTLPTDEFENEGLEFGEYIQQESNYIYEFKKSFVAVCSNPLGELENRREINQGGQGGGDIDCGNWQEGIISIQGFRFVKGWEAFATKPYWDSIGKLFTIGYGVTDKWDAPNFNKLNKPNGCTEEEASRVTYDILINKFGKNIVNAVKEMGCTEQYQFDALCSLAFNAGPSWVTNLNNELPKIIKANPKNETAIRNVWRTYRTGGEIGLINRRETECDVFFNKYITPPRPIATVDSSGKYGPSVKENDGNGWLPDCSGSGSVSDKKFKTYGYEWYYPSKGIVTSKFGKRTDPITGKPGAMHYGIDIGNVEGTPIYASRDGVVITAGWGNLAGNWVVIEHQDTKPVYRTIYMHNTKVLVKDGDRVKGGQQIALMGTTGNSTGVHCHYQLEKFPFGKDNAINPIPHLEVGDKI